MSLHESIPANVGLTDEQLVRQALTGQRSAYAELVRRWSASVLAVCHARVRCWHAAEDLAQEALLRGWAGLATLAAGAKFGPWLRGIAQRACLDWLKAKQSSQVPFTALSPDRSPEDLLPVEGEDGLAALQLADERRRLLELVHQLDEDSREVLLLYYYQDVTYAELAAQLGVSPATVNARLTKARAMLRERLRKQEC